MRGQASPEANNARVRITGQSISGPLPGKWSKLSLNRATGEFNSSVETGAGGFYTVEVQVRRGHHVLASVIVPHVGVGEVFVISGQSNSTNYGELPQTTQTGMVTTFSGDSWRIANDPQPGTQDNSKKGSFVPSFGDALYRKYHVPIGIASIGHGSTSVRQWLPAGEPVEVMPTMTRYVTQNPDGTLVSDGTLFNGMMHRIQQLGPHGFRAILWHQGESDSHQKLEHEISGETYRRMLEHVILSVRKRAGWDIPWLVANVSYGTPEIPSWPPVREAQQSLWKTGIALQGPDTDTLGSAYRQNNGKGVHFSDAGLKAHGLLWAQTVAGNPSCTPPAGPTRTRTQWFNPCAFAAPAIGTLGNAPRNFIQDQTFFNLDTSVHRLFPIKERLSLMINVEAYNVLNHPALGSPASSVTTQSTFGQINTTAFGNSQRILQFAGKIQF